MNKEGQLMSQPFIYIFYAVVTVLILFFGIRIIINLQDTGEEVEYRTFVNKMQENVERVYHDSYGSTISLEKISVPAFISEVCFASEYQEDKVTSNKLKEVIQISDLTDYNVYFADMDPNEWERNYIEGLVVEGTVCDMTNDGKVDLVLENIGTAVKVR